MALKRSIKAIQIMICVIAFNIRAFAADGKTIPYELEWQGNAYQGTYTGEISEGIPDGKGIFESENGTLQYEGQWESGFFQGNGVVSYGNGIIEEGDYWYGKRNGLIRIYSDENSYVESLYQNDIAYGRGCTFVDGVIVSEKLLIQGMDKDELVKSANSFSENSVKGNAWINQFVKVEGEVAFTYEDEKACHFRIEDSKMGFIMGEFLNTTGNGLDQRYMPRLIVGQHVRIFGKLKGYARNEIIADEDGYGWDCLVIDPYYGENVAGTETSLDTDIYAVLQNNPYEMYGKAVKGDFIIKQCLKKGDASYIWAVSEEESINAEQQYVLVCDNTIGENMFSEGTVVIEGFYAGQIKTASGICKKEQLVNGESMKTYKMFPAIKVCHTGED